MVKGTTQEQTVPASKTPVTLGIYYSSCSPGYKTKPLGNLKTFLGFQLGLRRLRRPSIPEGDPGSLPP